ncbi:MAG: hypothetical protein H6502_02080 [Candidatus Woesearchaeota archaeon]|nr:MAG: hypothetical protein H6502_02080 [Candidatus Woesearchaeota archaeon]
MAKYILFLIFILSLSFSSLVLAEDCCVGVTTGVGCIPGGGDIAMDGETCQTTFNGVWHPGDACQTIPACTTAGCCCVTDTFPSEAIANDLVSEAYCSAFSYFFYPGDEPSCATFCAHAGAATYVISGTVYGENNVVVPSQEVALIGANGNVLATTLTSSTDGTFSFPDLLEGTYFVATELAECEDQATVILSTFDQSVSLFVDCQDAACVPQWDCSACLNNPCIGGFRVTDASCCADLNDCSVPYPGGYESCNEETPFSCNHNGVIEGEEECDCNPVTGNCDFGALSCNPLQGSLSCIDCRISTNDCFDCNVDACSEEMCGVCDVCADSPVCAAAAECSENDVGLTLQNDKTNANEPLIKVSFTYSGDLSTCRPETIHLYRGESVYSSSTGFFEPTIRGNVFAQFVGGQITNYLSGSTVFEDDQLSFAFEDAPKRMYYKAVLQFSDGTFAESSWEHILLGHRVCYEDASANQYCAVIPEHFEESENQEDDFPFIVTVDTSSDSLRDQEPYRAQCNDDFQLQNVEDVEEVNGVVFCAHANGNPEEDVSVEDFGCIEYQGPGNQGILTKCIENTACDKCNSVFGLLANDNTEVTVAGETYACSENDIQDANICYKERTPTNVDKFVSCAKITSCYDYASQQTCQNNPCDAAAATSCAWNAFDETGTIGVGLCVPTNSEVQDCSRCEETFFPGLCTRDLCELLGTCFFNTYNNHLFDDQVAGGLCINEREIFCEAYDTQQECVDAGAYNIHFSGLNTPYAEGTNDYSIISPSHDWGSFGRCSWIQGEDQGYCIKNADWLDNGLLRDFELEGAPAEVGEVDCVIGRRNNGLGALCRTDNNSPSLVFDTSSVTPDHPVSPAYPLVPVAADDRFYVGHPLRLYFGLDNQFPTSEDWYGLLQGQEGYQTITMYTKDFSNNPSEVTQFSTYVDYKPPVIDLSSTIYMYEVQDDDFRAEVNITVTSSEHAFCEGTLTPVETNIIIPPGGYAGDGVQETSDFFGTQQTRFRYAPLSLGDYEFSLLCSDYHGNTIQDPLVHYVTIDDDLSITNPTPRLQAFSQGPIALSVRSPNATSCKWSYTQPTFTEGDAQSELTAFLSMPNSFSDADGDKTWTYSWVSPDGQSRVYTLFTGCQFSDGSVTVGRFLDALIFSYDKSPPQTFIYEINEQGQPIQFYNPYVWQESVRIRPICDDTGVLVFGTTDLGIGCGSITACRGPEPDTYTIINGSYVLQPNDVPCELLERNIATQQPHYWFVSKSDNDILGRWIYYYSTDAGGNAGPIQALRLRISDLDFSGPQVAVLNEE